MTAVAQKEQLEDALDEMRRIEAELQLQRNVSAAAAESQLMMDVLSCRRQKNVAVPTTPPVINLLSGGDYDEPKSLVREVIADWSEEPKGVAYIREMCAGYGYGDLLDVMEQFQPPLPRLSSSQKKSWRRQSGNKTMIKSASEIKVVTMMRRRRPAI